MKRFYFFETAGGHTTNYAGTLNEFFGLQAERGPSFNGTLTPATWPTPTAAAMDAVEGGNLTEAVATLGRLEEVRL